MPQYVICCMPKTHGVLCIWSHFAVCKPACFSSCCDPQSLASHISSPAQRAQTDDSSLTNKNFKISTAFFVISVYNYYIHTPTTFRDCTGCMGKRVKVLCTVVLVQIHLQYKRKQMLEHSLDVYWDY